MARRPIRIAPGLALALAGCGAPASPSLPLFGAYFPSWLICAGLGVLGGVLGRVIFIALGIDDRLPLRLWVYISLGLLVAFAAGLVIYGR